MEYACEPGSEGSTFVLRVDGKDSGVSGTVAKTAQLDRLPDDDAGRDADADGGDPHVLLVKPLTKPGVGVMNLRRITLVPLK